MLKKPTLATKSASIAGPELRPGDGAHKTGRAELVGSQHLVHKDANGPVELVEGIVQGNRAIWHNEREKPIEVALGAMVRVVSVDP